MAEILWTATARRALGKLSRRTQLKILKRVDQLAIFPNLGPKMIRRWSKYRQLLADQYRIIYQVSHEGDTVMIVYIRHQKRKLR